MKRRKLPRSLSDGLCLSVVVYIGGGRPRSQPPVSVVQNSPGPSAMKNFSLRAALATPSLDWERVKRAYRLSAAQNCQGGQPWICPRVRGPAVSAERALSNPRVMPICVARLPKHGPCQAFCSPALGGWHGFSFAWAELVQCRAISMRGSYSDLHDRDRSP